MRAPPKYKMAKDPARSCQTCAYFKPFNSSCNKYITYVDPNAVCDQWAMGQKMAAALDVVKGWRLRKQALAIGGKSGATPTAAVSPPPPAPEQVGQQGAGGAVVPDREQANMQMANTTENARLLNNQARDSTQQLNNAEVARNQGITLPKGSSKQSLIPKVADAPWKIPEQTGKSVIMQHPATGQSYARLPNYLHSGAVNNQTKIYEQTLPHREHSVPKLMWQQGKDVAAAGANKVRNWAGSMLPSFTKKPSAPAQSSPISNIVGELGSEYKRVLAGTATPEQQLQSKNPIVRMAGQFSKDVGNASLGSLNRFYKDIGEQPPATRAWGKMFPDEKTLNKQVGMQ